MHSASASSWGVADAVELDADDTSESDDDEPEIVSVRETADLTRPGRAPPKKRRHLGLEDVGRFASMSIDRDNDDIQPPDVSLPEQPPASSSPQPLKEMQATSVEEPESEDDDTAMQARRGPTIHQLDSNRFYVSSLSDDSSDEEDNADKAKQDRIDAVLHAGPVQTREDGSLVVNGVLINQLQAIESHRRQALRQERISMRRGNCTEPKDRGALILWKEPEHLALKFGSSIATPPTPMATGTAPPVVVEEGEYAYVHRPASHVLLDSFHSPTPSRDIDVDDAMEIDD